MERNVDLRRPSLYEAADREKASEHRQRADAPDVRDGSRSDIASDPQSRHSEQRQATSASGQRVKDRNRPITDHRGGTGLTRDQVRNDPLVWLQLVAEPASGLTLMLVEFEQSPKFSAKE